MNSKTHITIGLLWHSLVSGNLGVGALTESNIAIIKGVAERLGVKVRFLILGTGENDLPELTAELNAEGHQLECHKARVLRSSFRVLLKRCDFVVDIGEGDSFADIYGFKRFFFYWLSKNIVCSLGKPLILAPQTIGPFDGFFARILAKQVMARCAKVFARDHLSSQYLKDVGVAGNTAEAIDVAFRLPFTTTPKTSELTQVGINVSGLLFNGGYTGNNQFGLSIDYADVIRQLLGYFTALPQVQVHLIAHVIEPHMPVEDDLRTCKLLAKEFPNVIVAPSFKRPSEAKSYISGMDFFVGARMHACIAAFSSGVPVVPMAYSRKFNGLFGTLGYYHLADCKVDSASEIKEKIIAYYSENIKIKENIDSATKLIDARIKIYEGVIENQIRNGSER